MNHSSPEQLALRGLLTSTLGPVWGTLAWLLIWLISTALYPWVRAWSLGRDWLQRQLAHRPRLGWYGVVAACAALMTGLAVARHASDPALVAQARAGNLAHATATHPADGCAPGVHASARHHC